MKGDIGLLVVMAACFGLLGSMWFESFMGGVVFAIVLWFMMNRR